MGSIPLLVVSLCFMKLQPQHLHLSELPWKHRGMGKVLQVCPSMEQCPALPPPHQPGWGRSSTWAVSVSCSIHKEEEEMPGCCWVSSCVWIPLDFVGSRAIPPCVGPVALIGLVGSPQSCVFPRVCCCQTSFYPPHPSSSFVNPSVLGMSEECLLLLLFGWENGHGALIVLW